MTVDIHQIPREMMNGMMPHLAPHLSRGLRHVSFSADQLADEIRRDLTQVWAIFVDRRLVAAFLTSIHTMPDDSKTLDIYGLGGSSPLKWGRQLSDTMADFAKRNGCNRFVFAGKISWARICGNVEIKGVRQGDHMSFERAVA